MKKEKIPIHNNTSHKASPKKMTLFLLLAVFIMPVIAAGILVGTQGHAALGSANQGILINPPIAMESFLQATASSEEKSSLRKTWKILFIMPTQCDEACENTLYVMPRIEVALGPDRYRVQPWIYSPSQRQTLNEKLMPIFNGIPLPSEAGHLYLMDTHGNVFMHYPPHAERKDSLQEASKLVKDIKHALKLSRIG